MDPPEQGAENAAQKNELNRTDEVVTETIIELNQTIGVSPETTIESAELLRIDPEQLFGLIGTHLDQVDVVHFELVLANNQPVRIYYALVVGSDHVDQRTTELFMPPDRGDNLHFGYIELANQVAQRNGGSELSPDQMAPFHNPLGMRSLNQEARRDYGFVPTFNQPFTLFDLLGPIVNQPGTLFDSLLTSANQGFTPYNGLDIHPNHAALRNNESLPTDDRSNGPEPAETDRTGAREAPDELQQPEKSDKPHRLMLKNGAIIVIFAAVFYGARRMKKKIYG